MEYILSVSEMRQADHIAIHELGIPGLMLMENAGLKAAQCISRKFHPIKGKSIGIFCGKGNNGGDGFVIGRHLNRMGAEVTFWLTGKCEDVSGDAKVNLLIARKMGLPIIELTKWDTNNTMHDYHVLIDALLGTGLKGEVRGIYADIISTLNLFSGPVVAVDTPSGLDCDTGNPLGICTKADITVTMGNIKTGMLFYPGRNWTGDLFITDLNVPDFVFHKINPQKFLLQLQDYQRLLPERPPDAYKNTFGKILVVAGSPGLTGAATLCSLSALRSGAGMVILGCPKSLNPIFESKLTEVMTHPLPETETGTLSERAFDFLKSPLEWCHVIALGPGLGTHLETREFCQKIMTMQGHPIVIDADGLNNLTGEDKILREYPEDIVLTPHVGELSRLTEISIPDILKNPADIIRQFAQDWRVTLLLKGVPTIIGDPDGNLYFNVSGNAGMATAGSGDVLTGLIAGFLGQGLNGTHAAMLGAFVHGLCGNLSTASIGERGTIAGDLVDAIPEVLLHLENSSPEFTLDYWEEFSTRLF